jgi:hypothetical protein
MTSVSDALTRAIPAALSPRERLVHGCKADRRDLHARWTEDFISPLGLVTPIRACGLVGGQVAGDEENQPQGGTGSLWKSSSRRSDFTSGLP